MGFNLNDLDYQGREVYYVKTIDRKDQEIKSIKSHNKSLIGVLFFFVGIYILMVLGTFYNNNYHEKEISKIKKEYELKLAESNNKFNAINNDNARLKEILINYLAKDLESLESKENKKNKK